MRVVRLLLAFLANITEGQRRPQAKAIADLITAALAVGKVLLSEMSRWLSRGGSAGAIAVAKRLSNALRSTRFDDARLLARVVTLGASLLPADGAGVVIAVDDTAITKPWANPSSPKGQQHACRVRAAAMPGTPTVWGYHVTTVVASTSDNRSDVPLAFAPWSDADPEYVSQWTSTLTAVGRLAPHVGPEAIWVFDRGFDANAFYRGLDDHGVRWMVRLKSHRHRRLVVEPSGEAIDLRELWPAIPTTEIAKIPGSSVADHRAGVEIGTATVRLVVDGRAEMARRTLVVARRHGVRDPDPWVLLSSQVLETRDDRLWVIEAYNRRWRAETTIKLNANERGWGLGFRQVQVTRFVAVKRLMTITHAALLFVAWLRRQRPDIVGDLIASVGVKKKGTTDLSYRVVRGLGHVLRPGRPRSWRSLKLAEPRS